MQLRGSMYGRLSQKVAGSHKQSINGLCSHTRGLQDTKLQVNNRIEAVSSDVTSGHDVLMAEYSACMLCIWPALTAVCTSYKCRFVCRASFNGRHTLRMLRDSSIRCTTSLCALPMINMGYLDRDWYEGIVQKLKWNVPIRETDAADIAAFTSRSLLRHKGVDTQNLSPVGKIADTVSDPAQSDVIGPTGKNTVSNDRLHPQEKKDGVQQKLPDKVTAGTAQPKL